MTHATLRVLTSPELNNVISSYQHGAYEDMRGLRWKLCPLYDGFYDPSYIRPHMQRVDDFLRPWLAKHGMKRLPKLLEYCSMMRLILVQYAVHFGNMDLATHLHKTVNLLLFPRWLHDLAALNNQVDMLRFLQQIGHCGTSTRGLVWAAEFGHLPTVKYLIDMHKALHNDNVSRSTAARVAAKAGHLSIVRVLLNPKQQRFPQFVLTTTRS
ncbi:unnamed protein product [Aphanomyces euteiches]|uniref:Uncharacterized protein n=1 Tax=Aphanomyces euteiches TaxID=100861 RepID=A0A6G0WY59_9STRA|nr:hypothetical protein Ae201684_010531 [Aphanomyces euteiches]KAH9090010.1 hypothetical protein Ae201684P_014765 [Aphanomyces euteiches]KAH9155460.1 hypothetical protein AeRB84_002557 [Aphanomyces euteiches]